MAMQYKKVLYGGAKGIDVSKANIANISAEAGKYLKDNGMQAQGIKLPGLSEAQKLVAKASKELEAGKKSKFAQELGGSPELKIVAGIDTKGNLSATVTGILPPSKKGGKPIMFDETAIIRKEWNKLEDELKSDKNEVVNLTQDHAELDKAMEALFKKHGGDTAKIYKDSAFKALEKKFKGDKVINKAAARQAAKFKTDAHRKDEGDFGEITKGTVVLAAHGSRVEASGITLGTKLGKMTPQQIVTYLTEQKDAKKNLSKNFTGTLLLSGCFTAAGGIAPPNEKYDYDTFAGKVWNLLKAKGIKCKVQGMPGQARTGADGSKSSVKPTEQKAYDALKKEVKELDGLLKKAKGKLTAGDAKVKAAAQKKVDELAAKLKKAKAEKELKVMHELINSYGLDPVR
ncbi:MAG: hypothetical protein AAGD12_06120 [Pseudomonadota bacterium]